MYRTLVLVAVAALLPSLIVAPGAGESLGYNLAWTAHFAAHPFSRWMPSSFGGLGSPTFFFYPPLVFWLSGMFSMAITPITAVKVCGFVLLLFSGFSMRAWLRAIDAHPGGAVLYMLAPYHLYDFYVRGALAEFGAYVWIPLVALAIHRKQAWLVAVAYAGLILTHLPTAVLVSVFLVVPLAFSGAIRPTLMGCSIGAGLAAFYLVPALMLQQYVSTEALWSDFYRPSNWAAWEHLHDPTYVSVQLLSAFGLCVGVVHSRSLWSLLTIAFAAMALALVPALWNLPVLDRVQFPWRLLSLVEFAAITAICVNPPRRTASALVLALLATPYFATISLTIAGTRLPIRPSDAPPEYLPHGFDLSSITQASRVVDLSRYDSFTRAETITVLKPGIYSFGRFSFPIWNVEGQVPSEVVSFRANRPGTYKLERKILWQELLGVFLSMVAAVLAALNLVRERTLIIRAR